MDYEAAYAELEARKALRDEWYHIGLMLFRRLLDDGKWTEENEYRFSRKIEGDRPLTINLITDVLYGAGGTPRTSGLDYLLNMMQANGGTLEGIAPQKSRDEQHGKRIRLRPPYKVAYLSDEERKWHKRMPPEKEQLQEVVHYDEEIGRLYWVTDAGGQYEDGVTSAPDYFINIDGTKYARWRVISQLLFGNPRGIENLEECRTVLKNMPTNDAEWKKTRALMNKEYIEHMNTRGPNYRERKTPRLTEKIRAERALLEADQAELGKLRQQRAGTQRQIQIVTEKIEKEKETGPTRKPLSRRARLDAYFASLKEKT